MLTTLARRAYRRPPSAAEVDRLMGFFNTGRKTGGSFDSGVENALAFMLVSPQFLYRFERDPDQVPADGVYRLSDLELASRLSFFIWSSIPDDQLLNLAVAGKLHTPAVLDQQVKRMLADERARALGANFAGQWLYLRNLKSLRPDEDVFPDFDDNLRQALQRETEMLFESVVMEDRSVLDLLDADYTFLNERLARHYGVPNVYGDQYRRVRVKDDYRRGLLGQGSVLTLNSYGNRTSPVTRGKYVLSNILGTPPPPPPANVPPLDEKPGRALSMRERMEEHRANPACSGCHKLMDPIGLALENFDGIGRWRTSDGGVRIDASSTLWDGTRGGRTGRAAACHPRPSRAICAHGERNAAHLRARPGPRIHRHARGTIGRQGIRRAALPVFVARGRYREERAVPDESEAGRPLTCSSRGNTSRAGRSFAAASAPRSRCRFSTRWSRRRRRSRRPPRGRSSASGSSTSPTGRS